MLHSASYTRTVALHLRRFLHCSTVLCIALQFSVFLSNAFHCSPSCAASLTHSLGVFRSARRQLSILFTEFRLQIVLIVWLRSPVGLHLDRTGCAGKTITLEIVLCSRTLVFGILKLENSLKKTNEAHLSGVSGQFSSDRASILIILIKFDIKLYHILPPFHLLIFELRAAFRRISPFHHYVGRIITWSVDC